MYTHVTTTVKIVNVSIPEKASFCSWLVSLLKLHPHAATDLLSVTIALPFLEPHKNGIMYVVFVFDFFHLAYCFEVPPCLLHILVV